MLDPRQVAIMQAVNAKTDAASKMRIVLAMRAQRQAMKDKMEADAAYQARCRMTQDERRIEAIDITAKNRMERTGTSHEEARREVVELMTPAYNKVDNK